MKAPNIAQELLNDILQAISEDKPYDGKSIMWDGSKIHVIEDELDSKDILDGRSGPFMIERIETSLGIELRSFCTMHNSELISGLEFPDVDSSGEYRIETFDRYLSLKKYGKEEYESLLEALSRNSGLIEAENGMTIAGNNSHKTFSGLIETESGTVMIGYILLVKGSGDNAYSLAYAGIGNYSDIQVEASQIMNSFLDRNNI